MADKKTSTAAAKPKAKKFTVPYKKTMNLVTPDVVINWGKVAIIALVVIVLALAGAKFGILDPLDQKNAALQTKSDKEVQYASLNARMAEYAKVEDKYGRYSYGWMSESEAAMLEKEKVLEIVENKIATACTIESLSIANNTMSLSISGITLEQAREMVATLREDPNIVSAMIYSAVSTDETHTAKMSMTVVFQKEVQE